MKILTVIGARPQFVKAAAVSRAVAEHNRLWPEKAVAEKIVHTGQHFDQNMSQIFFSQMRIPDPDYFLGVHGLSHGAMTGQMLEKVEKVIQEEAPDRVLVYGDTNTTLAGALAAAKLHVPVAHVEAGLRSFNRRMPEEINRVAADHLSDYLLCPTRASVENLAAEGIPGGPHPVQVSLVGDVMLDAALFYAKMSAQQATVFQAGSGLCREKLSNGFALCTVHRAENTDDPDRLRGILAALEKIAVRMPVVFPVHPRTQNAIHALGARKGAPDRLFCLDPVGYFDMLELLKACSLVLTDSGGLQKEAYFFRKPCVTLRDETEWVELVQQGANALAGTSPGDILGAVEAMAGKRVDFDPGLYGDGNASRKIVELLSR